MIVRRDPEHRNDAPARRLRCCARDGGIRERFEQDVERGGEQVGLLAGHHAKCVRIAQHFGNGWQLTGTLTYVTDRSDSELLYAYGTPDATTGLPNKTKRTASTTVRVRDGQTVVIGGLRQMESRRKYSRIPIISEIPLLGELFKSHRIEHTSVELAVFITARILDDAGHLTAAEAEQGVGTRVLRPGETRARAVS